MKFSGETMVSLFSSSQFSDHKYYSFWTCDLGKAALIPLWRSQWYQPPEISSHGVSLHDGRTQRWSQTRHSEPLPNPNSKEIQTKAVWN